MSDFLKEQIEKQVKKLRADCAVKREIKRNAFGRRWALASRGHPDKPDGSDKYWDDLQAKEQVTRTEDLANADKTLAGFITEHRSFMGPDWIGNDHGRLCWCPFLGGTPIDQHYCEREENHDGPHADSAFAWPREVTNEHEWHKLRGTCSHPETSDHESGRQCVVCGKIL